MIQTIQQLQQQPLIQKSFYYSKKQSSSSDDEEWYYVVIPGSGGQTVKAKHNQLTEYGNRYITEDGQSIYV